MSDLCRHFGPCGGCLLQDVPRTEYLAMKRQAVGDALARHGLAAEVTAVAAVASGTRRRAVFKVAKTKAHTLLGFHARKSHDIVDMHECRLLTPKLFAAVAPLRSMMAALLHDGEMAELHVTETASGLDIALDWKRRRTAALAPALAGWVERLGLARVTSGGEVLIERVRPRVRIGKAEVPLPPKAFLQPTREGEAALQRRVGELFAGSKAAADLFSGCGTFALVLAPAMRVHAVERDKALLAALDEAARHTQGLKPITTESRDLFKLPLTPPELQRFDAVLLDPPRAGALAQAKELATSAIRRIAYVSCNPESFARDAKLLVDAGFALGPVTPVDQFRWSSHTELVAGLTRG